MRAHFASRLRSSSLSAVPPPQTSSEYSSELAKIAATILYKSPIPSQTGLPRYVLNAAAFPDADEVDFDKLLPYVLARLPGEEELIGGTEYEVIFFAGGSPDTATSGRKNRPGWGWFIQAYHVLSRAMRKRLQRLYIVHERSWVRILVEMFSTIVSPKFRRKIVHVSSLTALALHVPVEDLLIPASAYIHDRRLSTDIHSPYASGRRAFATKEPFPRTASGQTRLPRVLRETTSFLILEANIGTEGLFRIPPHARLREILREAYDRGQKFILWKDNGVTLPIPRYPRVQGMDQAIDEVDQRDAYGVLLAAGLLKLWYSELRQPIFPESTYQHLKRTFGDPDGEIGLDQLVELISPNSEWSKLPSTSRLILVRHLLPLLSLVASRSEQNKMTALNLAVCFAPALLCGPDQLEDAKVSSIIRRILTAAVEIWSDGLREACQVDHLAFESELLLPQDPAEWEDPLEAPRRPLQQGEDELEPDEKHFTGIVMHDNDATKEVPPPLPPRTSSSKESRPSAQFGEAGTKRKPAPPLTIPPRYSTVVQDSPLDITGSPATYATTTDGFAPAPVSHGSAHDGTWKTETKGGAPHPSLPKRKALTSEQISNSTTPVDEKAPQGSVHEYRMPLAGLTNPSRLSSVQRKPLNHEAESGDLTRNYGVPLVPQGVAEAQASAVSTITQEAPKSCIDTSPGIILSEFRRPGLPASARKASLPQVDATVNLPINTRGPSIITSLARPLHPITSAQQPRKASLPNTVLPKPRAASASLLQRMPSFEQRNPTPQSNVALQTPGRLNLRKASVEDLRKLYEERAGTAQSLVEAGMGKGRS